MKRMVFWMTGGWCLLASLHGAGAEDVVIDNAAFTLRIGADARVRSLVVKATGEEMLDGRDATPIFSVTQDRPFNNEVKLIHPNKKTTYPACSLRRAGESLVAGFSHRQYEAKVRVKQGAGYVAFTLEDFPCDRKSSYDYLKMDIPPVASFRVLQLPVKNRRNFGDWLNASWDEKNAVGVIGTSPQADVDHEDRTGYRLLNADLVAGIGLRGFGAAIVVGAGQENFLDAMDALEVDFGLPRGVKSRRGRASKASIFHLSHDVTPSNIAELISYAKRGGFRLMTFPCSAVMDLRSSVSWGKYGDYDWREDLYPNHEADLKKMLDRIKAAGISPGIHTLHSHIGLESRYVTPVADPRLNKTRRFTLAEPIPVGTNDIPSVAVFEPTADTPLHPACRILQFGGELLSYESYTTEPPYRFLNVKRGAWKTLPAAHARGEVGGILHVSEFGTPGSCYLDQNTDLQDEVAAKLAKFYNCGFEYLYLDGSEGVDKPFNFHVANAQLRFWKLLTPEPLFGEGAAKTHFGWHMLAGANAFDCFSPSVFKEKLRAFPFRQAPISWQDMTRVDFGWWGLFVPGQKDWWKEKIGAQADMWEFGAAGAAAWDCAMSINMSLKALKEHPRMDDLLEVIRRWEDVREKGWLTAEQRAAIKADNHARQFHLLVNGQGAYELVEIRQLTDETSVGVRAFLFERNGRRTVTLWHASGSAPIKLPFACAKSVSPDGAAEKIAAGVSFTLSNRVYLTTDASADEVVAAFK